MDGALNVFAHAFWETPPVTRTYISASVILTIVVEMDFLSPLQLYYNPNLIFKSHQYWRLITSFLYFAPFGYSFIFNTIFAYRYCRMLEEDFYRNRTADYAYLFLIGGTLMCILGCLVNLLFLGHAFTIMLVYVWSRRNPGVLMNLFGIITFRAPYLPWALLTLSILMGHSTVIDVAGIIVGHFYYFFEDVFPNGPHGFRVLATPRIIKDVFTRLGIDEEVINEGERPEQFNFEPQENNPPANNLNDNNDLENENDATRRAGSSNDSDSTTVAAGQQSNSGNISSDQSNMIHQDPNPDSQLRARNVNSRI